jgi:hypothetical protein
MQAELGLFYADQGRGIGMEEDGQQTEEVQRPIGKARSRDGPFQSFLVKPDLNATALNSGSDVFYSLIKQLELLQKKPFGLSSILKIVENEAQIAAVTQQEVVGEVDRLELPEEIASSERPTSEKTDLA